MLYNSEIRQYGKLKLSPHFLVDNRVREEHLRSAHKSWGSRGHRGYVTLVGPQAGTASKLLR